MSDLLPFQLEFNKQTINPTPEGAIVRIVSLVISIQLENDKSKAMGGPLPDLLPFQFEFNKNTTNPTPEGASVRIASFLIRIQLENDKS